MTHEPPPMCHQFEGPALRRLWLAVTLHLLELQITISDSHVTKCEIRIAIERLLEFLERLANILRRPLVPVVSTAQIKLIGFRVGGVALCQLLLLFASQS